jgi:hypothetical protein
MGTFTLLLPDEQAAKLTEAARGEGVEVAELLRRITDEYLELRAAFSAAAGYVLRKNAELYRRLAK